MICSESLKTTVNPISKPKGTDNPKMWHGKPVGISTGVESGENSRREGKWIRRSGKTGSRKWDQQKKVKGDWRKGDEILEVMGARQGGGGASGLGEGAKGLGRG
jgi:hypothetical protein